MLANSMPENHPTHTKIWYNQFMKRTELSRHLPVLTGLMAAFTVLTILVRVSGDITGLWLLLIYQVILYTTLHELSHGIVASLLDVPIDSITIGPKGISRRVLTIGRTRLFASWLPLGVTIQFGWSRLTRPKQIGLGISGALLPLATWTVAGWTWHTMLLTGLLSWMPSLADGRLIVSRAPRPKRPDVLCDQNQRVPITAFEDLTPTIYRIDLDDTPRPLNKQCWLEFVARGSCWQMPMTVLERHKNSREMVLQSEGSPYPVDRRRARRRTIRIHGTVHDRDVTIAMCTQDISRSGIRFCTDTPIVTGSIIDLEVQWKTLSWHRPARILRCHQQGDATWDLAGIWSESLHRPPGG